MRGISRRQMLAGMLGAWGASCLGRPSFDAWALEPWAGMPSGIWQLNQPPMKILEIFLSGGLSQWETFYVTGNCGGADVAPNWRGFGDDVAALNWQCEGGPNASDEVRFFAKDALGQCVFWGPATRPLWDLMDFTRMVTVTHDLLVHELAGPLAVTGHRLAHPRMSGLGAMMQHYWLSRVQQSVPYSYVLDGGDGVIPQARQASVATGLHPGFATPLFILFGDSSFQDQLARSNIVPAAEPLFDAYRRQYRDLLRWQGGGEPLRSIGYNAYEAAAHFLESAPELEGIFGGNAMVLEPGQPCADLPGGPETTTIRDNSTKRALELAAVLLDKGRARHVLVSDRGLYRANNGRGYDTHGEDFYAHVELTSVNLFNVLYHLRRMIDPALAGLGAVAAAGQPAAPAAIDAFATEQPAKIRLSNTIIRIFSEFGRGTGTASLDGSARLGRDHWPHHFNLLIGHLGQGRRIVGGLDEDGRTVAGETDYGVQDVIGGLAVAAHINPFAPENFANGEFTKNLVDQGNEHGTTERLKQVILGA